MKVSLVTLGEYKDYHVLTAFDSEDGAAKFVETLKGSGHKWDSPDYEAIEVLSEQPERVTFWRAMNSVLAQPYVNRRERWSFQPPWVGEFPTAEEAMQSMNLTEGKWVQASDDRWTWHPRVPLWIKPTSKTTPDQVS